MERKALSLKDRLGTGSRRVMMLSALIMFITAVPLFSAGAAGQTNPHREHVLRTERSINQAESDENQARGESYAAFEFNGKDYTVDDSHVALTRTQEPALHVKGKWNITLNGKAQKMSWILLTADSSGNYTTEYMRDPEKTTVSTSVESCDIVTEGEYRMVVYVDFEGEEYYCNYADFTVSGNGKTELDKKVESVVDACTVSGDPWETALKLHDWLTENAYYDQGLEYYSADGVLLRGTGVCDSYSKAYELLCQKAGIPVRRVLSSEINHAWNAIQVGEEWYHVDVSWDDPVVGEAEDTQKKSGKETHDYFCLNDDLTRIKHNQWDDFSTPCTSLDANYYIHGNIWTGLGNETIAVDHEGNNVVTSYSELAANRAKKGETSFTLLTDQFYIKITQDGSSINTAALNDEDTILLRWSLLAELMSRTAIEGENGVQYNYEVTFDRSKKIFSFVLKGH